MKSKINDFKEFTKNEIINKLGRNEFELISIPKYLVKKQKMLKL